MQFEIDFGGLKRVLSFENGFGGDFSAHLTNSYIWEFYKVVNSVLTPKSQKKPSIGLETT